MKRKMSLRIYFENEQDKLPVSYNLKILLRKAIETTLDFEDYHAVCEVSVTFTDTSAPAITLANTETVSDKLTMSLPVGAKVSDLIANVSASDNRDGSIIVTSQNVLLMNTEDGSAVKATDALISGATYRITAKDAAGNEAFVNVEVRFN